MLFTVVFDSRKSKVGQVLMSFAEILHHGCDQHVVFGLQAFKSLFELVLEILEVFGHFTLVVAGQIL